MMRKESSPASRTFLQLAGLVVLCLVFAWGADAASGALATALGFLSVLSGISLIGLILYKADL